MRNALIMTVAWFLCLSGYAQPTPPIPASAAQAAAGIAGAPFYLTPLTGGGGVSSVIASGAIGDGSTDDTAAIQTALNRGGSIVFPPKTYLVSNLYVTNNTQLWGYGATLKMNSTVTNIAVLNWVAGLTNVAVFGLTLDGGNYTAVSSASVRNAGSTNRMGLNIYVSGGSVVRDVTCIGFDKGVTAFGDQNTSAVWDKPGIVIEDNNVRSNYFGIHVATTNANNAVEYFSIRNNRVTDNVYGIYKKSGNVMVAENMVINNFNGITVDGASPSANVAHNGEVANTVNHNNNIGIFLCNFTSATGGEDVSFNQIFANTGISGIVISNASGVRVQGNSISTGQPVYYGTPAAAGPTVGANFVFNNSYQGTWSIGGNFYVYDWALSTDQTTNMVHYNNYSFDTIGNRDSYLTDPNQNTGTITVSTTNLAPIYFLAGQSSNAPCFITNLTGTRAMATVDFKCTVAGLMSLSNGVTTEKHVIAAAATGTNFFMTPPCSTNDWWELRGETGTETFITNNWHICN